MTGAKFKNVQGARLARARGPRRVPVRYTNLPGSAPLIEATRLHKRGQLELCAELYALALAREPESLDAALNRAAVLLLTGPPSHAREALSAAEPFAQSNARACRDVGFAWLTLGETDHAESAFGRALALDPSLVGAHLARAETLLELDRSVAAIEQAREAVTLAPHQAAAHLVLHNVLFEVDPDSAQLALARAIDLDPAWMVPTFLRACGLATRGQAREAKALVRASTIVKGFARIVDHARTLCRGLRTFTSRARLLRCALDRAPRDQLALEFGVHHGASTRVLAKHLDARRGEHEAPCLFAFDSFRGLPEAWQGRAAGVFSTHGEVPPLPRSVEVHTGLFEDTLPAFLADHDGPVGFVHLDADLYSSTRTVLEHLEARLGDGTVLVFDEYVGNASWEEDEFRAFREFTERSGHRYEHLAVNWLTGQVAVRLSCRGGCPLPLR